MFAWLDGAAVPGGYGWALLQALVSLLVVCLLAWLLLRFAARSGMGLPGAGRRVRVLERVVVDARRSLLLVAVGERVFLIGSGEGGALSLIAEMDHSELPEVEAAPPRPSFAEVLARLRGRGP